MGEDKDFSVFIKSGHVLYCFFLCCLFPFESIWEKQEKYNSRKNKPFYSIRSGENSILLFQCMHSHTHLYISSQA